MMRALVAAAALLFGATLGTARAEVSEIRIGKQYGFSYMQLILMQDRQLIEKHAKETGLGDIKVEWVTLAGPSALNDALLSGSIDFVAIGFPTLANLWAKTRGANEIRGLTGANTIPLMVVTRNPKVKTLADFGPESRIAVPSVKISMQSILLQIEAARLYGDAQWEKFDPLTVTLAHPDALAAVLSGKGEVDSHFSSPPFQDREMAQPGVHAVTSSYDIVGPHSVSTIVTSAKFRKENPKIVDAFLNASEEATQSINKDKRAAAETYLKVTKEKMTVEELLALMDAPGTMFTRQPMGSMKIADFLFKTGRIPARPQSWKEMYFDTAYGFDGS